MKNVFERSPRPLLFFTLTLGGLVLHGCSSQQGGQVVSGSVKMGGKPLAYVGVRFYNSAAGESLVAGVDASGEYVTPSPLKPGAYLVSITGRPPGGDDPNAPPATPGAPSNVPKQYLNGATSNLVANVTPSETKFDFELAEKAAAAGGKNAKPTTPVVFQREL